MVVKMKSRINENHWLITRAAAHRGFHGNGIAENSKSAFLKAIELNYPIETDIQLTKDGVPVCFHDDNLKRITGIDSLVLDKTLAEIKELEILDSGEKILTFEEFLTLVDGKVPLLIEIKTQKDNELIVEKTLNLLNSYKGEFVIQSFDPRVMRLVRKANPKIIRGQLMCSARHKNVSLLTDRILSNGLLNFLSKPDFINMNKDYLPVSKRIAKGKKILCWTIRNEEDEQKVLKFVDGYVFENITPTLK